MIAAVANLSLARGTAYDVSLLIQDAAGVPLDLSATVTNPDRMRSLGVSGAACNQTSQDNIPRP